MILALAWIMESIHPFINRKVVVLKTDTPARDAAKAMREKGIGCVLVADANGRLVGIVTDRDFGCKLVAESEATTVPLSRIMTTNLITATTNNRLIDIVHLMEKHGIRRIPLVDPTGSGSQRCVGMVTLDDLIASRLIDAHQVGRIVQRQIGRRILGRHGTGAQAARAAQRSETRAQQVLHRFYEKFPEETGLPDDLVQQVGKFLLGALARRLSYSGAAHFAAQLPISIQEHLLSLPPGPDRSITPRKLQSELVERFKYSPQDAYRLLRRFFGGLNALVDSGEVEHVKAQLPKDFLELFTPLESELPSATKKAA